MSFDSFLKRPPIGESLEAVLLDFCRVKSKKRCLGGSKTLGVQLGPFWLRLSKISYIHNDGSR